jgi:glycosyltransferase involved in cell wall biosynthesis
MGDLKFTTAGSFIESQSPTIGLIAIFRNEADVLKEFIDHHIWQGIDHFYLIDNASTDDYQSIIRNYTNITILNEPRLSNQKMVCEDGPQISSYNKALKHVTTDWVYVCDLDEFVYGPSGYTLKSFIIEHGDKFDQLLISLKTFTSNGHIKQPNSVVDGFTERCALEKYTFTKGCVKRNKIHDLDITDHTLTHGITTSPRLEIFNENFTHDSYTKNGSLGHLKQKSSFRKRTDDSLYTDPLVINHYTTMSKERYFSVKPNRGIVSWEPYKGKTTLEFFQLKWDKYHSYSLCQDVELKNIKKEIS